MERPQQAQPLHCPESLHTTWLSQSCDLNGWAWAGGQSICSKESGGVRGLHYPEQLAGCPGSCPPHDLSQQYPGSLSVPLHTSMCLSTPPTWPQCHQWAQGTSFLTQNSAKSSQQSSQLLILLPPSHSHTHSKQRNLLIWSSDCHC